MKHIYLVRHTEAAPADPGEDDARHLTPAGRKHARKVGKTLRKLDTDWDLVLTSPLVRAVQTAELAAAGLKTRAPVAAEAALQPGEGTWDRVLAAAERRAPGQAVAFVGHEPDLGIVLGQALRQKPVALSKGDVVRLALDAGRVSAAERLDLDARAWKPLPVARPKAAARTVRPRRQSG